MSLAQRLGLPRLPGYVPAAFVATAFALGVHAALVLEALRGSGYPPDGRALATWSTLAVILASLLLHAPFERAASLAQSARRSLQDPFQRRAVILEPHPEAHAPPTVRRPEHNGQPPAQRLSARIHSPLAAGPVVAPDETLPVTVEAEPEPLTEALSITFEVHGPEASRTVHRTMEGTRIVEGFQFKHAGGFEVHVRLEHPDADPVEQTLKGRVGPYREETARLFEALKERLAEPGLDVGPQSTPREVCNALGTIDAGDPANLADLAVELEVALYGDAPVERATYETVYTAIQGLSLPSQGARS